MPVYCGGFPLASSLISASTDIRDDHFDATQIHKKKCIYSLSLLQRVNMGGHEVVGVVSRMLERCQGFTKDDPCRVVKDGINGAVSYIVAGASVSSSSR